MKVNQNRKMLILSERARGYTSSLIKAFNELGLETDFCIYDMPLIENKWGLFKRISKKMFDPNLERDYRLLFNDALRSFFGRENRQNYNCIIIIRGHYFDKDNENFYKSIEVPKIHWAIDSMQRAKMQFEVGKLSDFRYVIDKKDVENYDNNVEWLPLGYEDSLFYAQDQDKDKDIDVFMSGNVGNLYKRRRRVLERLGLSDLAQKYKCYFVGTTGSRFQDLTVKVGNVKWIAKYISLEELANYQSRAKICINVLQDDGGMPVNPSFFSIPASGSCLLNDKREYLHAFMIPGKEFEEFEENDFLEKLEKLLIDKDRRRCITKQGNLTVRTKHTMKERAKKILKRYERM